VELSAILLARVISFFETVDIMPRHGIFFPELVKEIVQRYNFQKFPGTFDEWNSPEGAQFLVGKQDKIVIDRLIVYNNGLQLETHAGTADSKRIQEELLAWARDEFGIAYGPDTVKRWAYVSGVTFHSNVPILVTGPIERLARNITDEISRILGDETVYQPTGFNIGHDLLLRKYARASFTLHRRAEVPFAENKYFSEAPLPTEIHLDLLARYEKDVTQMLNAG
jgi:hypothetical protein